ncbi:MAG: metallophosphoesterase family protein [Candidatus Micrarchaeota archaeon]|nr:metallophosphoesterase family protein [Candidatus Micrarchaeota archaeon]
MRIAILGDFHFGYDRFYDDSFIQAARALKAACDSADLILVAGDIFDERVPKQETIARAFEVFSQATKPVLVIAGTHERRPQGFVNPVELLCKAGFAQSCHARSCIFESNGEKVAVYGLAGVPEEYAKAAIEKLAPTPVEGAFNIFMFHQNVKDLMPAVEHGLATEDLPKGFGLYVCGHLHKNYELRKDGVHLLVPGSTVLTQLRREEVRKGFYLYDTAKREATFVPIDTRPFIYRELTLGKPADLKAAVEAELSRIDPTGKPIVRIDISSEDFSGIDLRALSSLQEAYAGKFILSLNIAGAEAGLERDSLTPVAGHAQGATVRERGLAVLKKVVEKNGHNFGNVEELFELACDASEEQFREYIISMASGKHSGGSDAKARPPENKVL